MSVVRIIARSGGGVDKVFSDTVAIAFAKAVGKPLVYVSNLSVGTSAGGEDTIATSLINGTPIQTEEQIWQTTVDRIHTVFDQSVTRKIESVDGYTMAKYDAGPLNNMMLSVVGSETKLSDFSNDFMVYAADIKRQRPHYFQSMAARQGAGGQPKQAWDYYAADAMVATSSAPTYFPAHFCRNMLGEEFTLVDGGLYTNNPSEKGLVLAMSMYGLFGHQYQVLSLGTGKSQVPFGVNSKLDWGKLQYLPHINDLIFGLNEASVEDDMGLLLRHNFLQANDDFLNDGDNAPHPSGNLDDGSMDNVERLIERAEFWIKNNQRMIDEYGEDNHKNPTKTKEELYEESAYYVARIAKIPPYKPNPKPGRSLE